MMKNGPTYLETTQDFESMFDHFSSLYMKESKSYTRVWRLPVRAQLSVRLGFGNQTCYQASGDLSGDMADHITSNFLKVVFHKSYLVYSWISWPNYRQYVKIYTFWISWRECNIFHIAISLLHSVAVKNHNIWLPHYPFTHNNF